jgi:hypothetical protein
MTGTFETIRFRRLPVANHPMLSEEIKEKDPVQKRQAAI